MRFHSDFVGTRGIDSAYTLTRYKQCGVSKFADFYGNNKTSKIMRMALRINSAARLKIMHDFWKITEFLL